MQDLIDKELTYLKDLLREKLIELGCEVTGTAIEEETTIQGILDKLYDN